MTNPVVDIKKLWTVFKNGDKEVVIHKDLDLTVQRGEILSLVGGSGTGKTVLLRQMLGLEHPTKGEITVLGQPVSDARSMALHESQSLSFEMQLGSHAGFVQQLAPLVARAFGNQPAFEPANLHRLMTRVKPGLIRVDADEVTYPAHVILRYEIERPLVEGEIEAEDIPALWDAKMQELLGLDTRGNFTDGPLQDVHWPEALFGYFPCYSLGAMYAAQWFAAMRRAMPDLDARIGQGDLTAVFDWLRDNIWSQASRWTTDELALRASGETLNPAHFKAHLLARYVG